MSRMFVSRKTVVLLAAAALSAGILLFLTVDSSPEISVPKPMTLADVQKRREETRAAEAAVVVQSPVVQSPAAASPRVTPPDRWSVMKDPTERSLVGLPFKMSESVELACARRPQWNDCKRLNAFLERMTAEARDPSWAPGMEARIERFTYEGERGQYRIRALECRSTRCALEVASESKNVGISYVGDNADRMFPISSAIAAEHDPQTGIRTNVIVQVWQKSAAHFVGRDDE
jgi:hypothetical protein